jgi:hypothetical protein
MEKAAPAVPKKRPGRKRKEPEAERPWQKQSRDFILPGVRFWSQYNTDG